MIHLDLDDLTAVAEAVLGGPPQLRDWGLLDSARQRPQTVVFGYEPYPTLTLKAAALLHALVTNHALVDGNKRLGWVAMRLFLRYNGADVQMHEDDSYDLIMEVAKGNLDVQDVAVALKVLGSTP